MATALRRVPMAWRVGILAVAAALPVARASIVFRDIPDIHMAQNGASGDFSSFVDLDGDGTDELRFQLRWNNAQEGQTHTHVYTVGTLSSGVAWRGDFGGTFPRTGAESMPAGFVLLPLLPPPPGTGVRAWNPEMQLADTNVSITDHGWWTGPGYLGVRFARADGIHYGWISMSATPSSIDIYSLAYESTPDAPIAVGAVPAPGAGVLLLGSLAGAGLRRGRRRGSSGRIPWSCAASTSHDERACSGRAALWEAMGFAP